MTSSLDDSFMQELELCKAAVDERLDGFFTGDSSYGMLLESMRYSLMSAGKRIRAVICIKFCEAVGGTREAAMEAACAIEMLHAYSLIHDDLPCMDDDDMRRGLPSNHVKYGETTAVLAGDALQAAAFETILKSGLPATAIVKMACVLAEAAGPHGICGGQYLDLNSDGTKLNADELMEINSMKTAALLSASASIGVIAGGGSSEQMQAAEGYAQAVGRAFQLRDDVLDCTATTEQLGKTVGSDDKNNRVTYVTLLGVDACKELIKEETSKAINALKGKFSDVGFLTWFARALAKRNK